MKFTWPNGHEVSKTGKTTSKRNILLMEESISVYPSFSFQIIEKEM